MDFSKVSLRSLSGTDSKVPLEAVEESYRQAKSKLNEAIANQRELQKSQSFLSKALVGEFVGDKFHQELIYDEIRILDSESKKKTPLWSAELRMVDNLVDRNSSELASKKNTSQVVTEMAKTACLFLPEFSNAKTFLSRRFGLLATAGVFALDEWKPASKKEDQIADLTLGALKGIGLKASFGTLAKFQPEAHYKPAKWLTNAKQLTAATQGVFLGVASRAIDTALSRNTYLDEKGKLSLNATTKHYQDQVFNPAHIGSDLIAFGIGSGLQKAFGTHISTHISAATFGFANGVARELNNQIHEAPDQQWTPEQGWEAHPAVRLLKAGSTQATLDSIAAIPGAYLHRQQVRNHFKDLHIKPKTLDKNSLENRFRKESEELTTFDAWTIKDELLRPTTNATIYAIDGHDFPVVVPNTVWKNGDGKHVIQHNEHSTNLVDKSNEIGRNKYALAQYLDELPRSDIIREIELRPDEKRFYWKKLPANAAASMSTENTMCFYNQPSEGISRAIVFHEWSHGLHNHRPQDLKMFEHAAQLEEKGFYANDYATRNPRENWAVHMGEVFLKPDVNAFLRLARYAPMRAVAIARSIEATLLEVPESKRGLYGSQFLKRAHLIRQELEPQVINELKTGKEHPELRQLFLDDLTKPTTNVKQPYLSGSID